MERHYSQAVPVLGVLWAWIFHEIINTELLQNVAWTPLATRSLWFLSITVLSNQAPCSLNPISLLSDAFPSQWPLGWQITHSHVYITENLKRRKPRPYTLPLCPPATNFHVPRSVPFPCFWAILPTTASLSSYLPSSCPTHAEPPHWTENTMSGCLVCSGDSEVTCTGCMLSRAWEKATVLTTVWGSLAGQV